VATSVSTLLSWLIDEVCCSMEGTTVRLGSGVVSVLISMLVSALLSRSERRPRRWSRTGSDVTVDGRWGTGTYTLAQLAAVTQTPSR